jgi:hypothetical protein
MLRLDSCGNGVTHSAAIEFSGGVFTSPFILPQVVFHAVVFPPREKIFSWVF